MTGGWKRLMLGLSAFAPIGAASAPVIEVVPLPETLLPDGQHPIAEPFTVGPGNLLLSGRIVRTEAAVSEGATTVSVDRFSDTIAPGDEMTAVLVSPAIAATLGTSVMYCGRDQRSRSTFASIMIGNMGSKFREIVRFCFLDADGDGKFERYLLAGAKDKLLQAPKNLQPLPYRIDRLRAMHAEDEVNVWYRKYVPETNKVELEVEVVREGKKTGFDYILWTEPQKPALQRLYPRMITNPAKIPYPAYFNNVIGATIQIRDVTPTGDATVVIERDFPGTLFRPVVVQVRYIFIYY